MSALFNSAVYQGYWLDVARLSLWGRKFTTTEMPINICCTYTIYVWHYIYTYTLSHTTSTRAPVFGGLGTCWGLINNCSQFPTIQVFPIYRESLLRVCRDNTYIKISVKWLSLLTGHKLHTPSHCEPINKSWKFKQTKLLRNFLILSLHIDPNKHAVLHSFSKEMQNESNLKFFSFWHYIQ